jgi:hypothetical protein
VKNACAALIVCSLAASRVSATTLKIVGPGGEPAVGAKVSVLVAPSSPSLLEQFAAPVTAGTTDDNGRIEVAVPKIDRDVFILVDHPGFLPLWERMSKLRGGIVELSAAATRGRLTPSAGNKLEGSACASWRRTLPLVMHEVSFERCAALRPSGDFTIPGVESGVRGTLTVKAKGYLPASRPLGSEALLALTAGVEVSGVVTSTSGAPISGARLKTAAGVAVDSDELGRFAAVCSLPETLEVRAPGFRSTRVSVSAIPTTQLAIRLVPGPTLQGTVTTAGGGVLPELNLQLVRHDEGGWQIQRLAIGVERGAFLVDLPGAGPFTLRITAPAYRSYESPRFTAGKAERIDLGEIRLSSGSGIDGRINEARSGAPVAGALVLLLPRGTAGLHRLARQPTAQTVTDEEGHYHIAGQAEGSYELRVRRDGFAETSVEVTLDDETLLTKDLHLGHGAEVHGVVSSRGGRPGCGLGLRFSSRSGSSLAPVAQATTGDDGKFSGVQLGGGEYRVEVIADTVLLTQELVVPDDEETMELALTIPGTTLHGRVLRDGVPVEGGSLRLAPVGQTEPRMGKLILEMPGGTEIVGPPDPWQETPVAADGEFMLPEAPTGAVSLVYNSVARGTWRWTRQIPLRDVAYVVLTFEGGRVRGRAIDAQNGAAVGDAMASVWDESGTLAGQAISDTSGLFVIEGLAANWYTLDVSHDGYRRATVGPIEVERGGGRVAEVRLEPSDSSAISIRLSRASGQPFAFGFVSLISSAGELVRSLSLDETGEREFRDLEPGVYRLAWSDPSVGAGASEPLLLEGGKETVFARRLGVPGELELQCTSASCAQSSIENLVLLTTGGFDLAPLLPGFSSRLRLSAGGRVSLGAVQPGSYLLRLRTGGSIFDRTVTIQPGEVVAAPVLSP